MWIGRFATYIAGALGIIASLIAAFGWGTYDPATGMFDLHPINITALGGMIIAGAANLMAALAVVRGWGGKAKP